MGIKGLYSYIAKEQAYEIIDLVGEAKKKGEIEILVDFNAFRRFLNETILSKLMRDFDNPFLSLLCSEYEIYSDAYLDFHNCFAEIGIKLVWIIDSVKGIDLVVNDQKATTWIYRKSKTGILIDQIISNCKTQLPMEDLENIIPGFSFEITTERLKRGGAEVIQLLIGGSDEFIASEFHRRKSFAIITDDTDFLVFPGCTIIFSRLMNVKYESILKLPFIDNENPGRIFKSPTEFRCPIITQHRIMRLLKLNSPDQFIVMSIIKGTDNTTNYFQDLQLHLRIIRNIERFSHVTHVANYIVKRNITAENIFRIREIIEFLNQFPNIRASMEFCLNFYSLQHFHENQSTIQFDPNITTNSLTDFFRRKLSNIEICRGIYSCHLGKFTNEYLSETVDNNCPSISSILLALRSKIYPYILIENKNQIFERSRDSPDLFPINIEHAPFKTNEIIGKPDSESERQNGVVYGIDLFEEIWSHLEDNPPLNYINRFGYDIGFICYILRYFYKITNNINMKLSIEEFTALFAAIFYQYGISKNIRFNTRLSRDTFMGMNICPSERCLMMFSWFVEVYFHGKYLCGNAFNVTECFPSMEMLFSSSAFVVFYENVMNHINERLSHLEESIHGSITSLQEQVLNKFRNEFDIITQ